MRITITDEDDDIRDNIHVLVTVNLKEWQCWRVLA